MMRPSNRPYQEVYAEWAREVQRLMSLRHPNVVYIHDAFEQSHLFYLALERCDHPLTAMLGTPMQEGLVLEPGYGAADDPHARSRFAASSAALIMPW